MVTHTHSYPPLPVPRARVRDAGVMQQPPGPGHPIQQDLTSENARLRETISQLEHKLQGLRETISQLEHKLKEKEKKRQDKEKQGR